jgi:uncharacterized protein
MEESTKESQELPTLPFNNLYLISGLVHGYNKVWMYVFTIALLVFGYFSFQMAIFYPLRERLIQNGYSDLEIIQNVALIFDSEALKIDRNIIFILELLMFVLAFIGFYIGLRFLHQKTLTSVLTGFDRFRFKRFWFAFTIWGSLIIIALAGDYLLNPGDYIYSFNPAGFIISFVIMALFMPVQTGLEEILFRGYMIQGLSLIFKNGIIPLIITSLLFAFAHMTNPEVKEFGWEIMFTYYCIFALFMGGITLLDEGIELALGIHFSNNFISSIFVTSKHSVIKTYSIFEAVNEDPYSEIILWVCMALVTFGAFWFRYRWKNFNLLVK